MAKINLDKYKSCDPIVYQTAELMNQCDDPLVIIAEYSGVTKGAIEQWRWATPKLSNVRAVLNYLGYDLAVVKLEDK